MTEILTIEKIKISHSKSNLSFLLQMLFKKKEFLEKNSNVKILGIFFQNANLF